MTPPPSQRNRAHNLRIVGTISNDTESLDWEPIESKLLAAAAYVAPRRILYLRFQTGEIYRYFTFPADLYLELLEAESKGRYFLSHIRNRFPYQKLLAHKRFPGSEQDGVRRTLTLSRLQLVFVRTLWRTHSCVPRAHSCERMVAQNTYPAVA
jgi:hypothetical protein